MLQPNEFPRENIIAIVQVCTTRETDSVFLDKSASSFTSAPRCDGFEKSPEKLRSISEEAAVVIKCTLKAVSQSENDAMKHIS